MLQNKFIAILRVQLFGYIWINFCPLKPISLSTSKQGTKTKEASKPEAAGREAVNRLCSGSGSAYWLMCVWVLVCARMHERLSTLCVSVGRFVCIRFRGQLFLNRLLYFHRLSLFFCHSCMIFSSVFISSLGWLGHETKPIRMSMPCALCPILQTGHQPFCLSASLFLLWTCWPCKCRNQRRFIYSAVVFCDLFVPLSSSSLLFFTPLSSGDRRGRVQRPYRRSKRV